MLALQLELTAHDRTSYCMMLIKKSQYSILKGHLLAVPVFIINTKTKGRH